MRIVQVLPMLEGGGAEAVAVSLAIGLAQRGHVSAVISLYPSAASSAIHRRLVEQGVTVGSLAKRGGPSPRTVIALRSWLRGFAPHVVHTHVGGFLYGCPAAVDGGFPLIHTVHNDPRYEVPPMIGWMHTRAYRHGAQGVVLSERFVGSFRDVHSCEPVGVVPNGIDAARIGTTRLGVGDAQPGSFRVVMVGRLEKQKRVDVFLEALAGLARSSPIPIEARILGSGPLRDELEALVNDLGLDGTVDFEGRVIDVGRYLEWADAFALSSDYEGMPLSIVEAMASGLPVVATRVGAVPDLVLDGITGILVDRRDPRAFAASLARLARDTELRETMGNAGRDRSGMFNVEAMVGGYESVYARVCAPDA